MRFIRLLRLSVLGLLLLLLLLLSGVGAALRCSTAERRRTLRGVCLLRLHG